MNDYELKQQRRRQRYEERADRARANAEAHYDEAGRLAKLRPVGQPILVGHHSERSARADQRRIERNMNKSCDELSKAEHYAAKVALIRPGRKLCARILWVRVTSVALARRINEQEPPSAA